MITEMPQSEGRVVGFKISGKLTDEDYESVLIPRLENIFEREDKARLLLEFDDSFAGWEASAMLDDAKLGINHLHDFEAIAFVGAPDWLGASIRMIAPLMGCEVKLFGAGHTDEAWQWTR